MTINVGHFTSTKSLHEGLAAVLGFPGWYGQNWDAFRDCIFDPQISSLPPVLVIRGCEILAKHLPRDAKILQECLEELKDVRPEIEVQWEVWNEKSLF